MMRYFAKCAKRVSVTEPKVSDIPDKRQHNGIGGEASVNVAIGGETSVTVAVIDSQQTMKPSRSSGQRCRLSEYDYSRFFDELITALKRLVICLKIVGQ